MQTLYFEDDKANKFQEVNVGVWNPIFGVISQDVLFPHIEHRFRNATLKLLTYHVSIIDEFLVTYDPRD